MNKKDRLSIHVENGQTDIYEAVTILRNGGTPSQSGLVGITNIQSQPNSAVMPSAGLPETILNVQTSGICDVRFSSQDSVKTRLTLSSNGNGLPSGLSISHSPGSSPVNRFSYMGQKPTSDDLAGEPAASVAGDFGKEITFLSQTHNDGFRSIVGIGHPDHVTSDTNATVYIAASGNPRLSGVLGLREQSKSPTKSNDYGHLYVKPYTPAGSLQTQALYFQDDYGNEFNLTQNQDDYFGGHVYGNEFGNTYAGWYTPKLRISTSSISRNTLYGYGIQPNIGSDNTFYGHQAGSGNQGSFNTVVGSQSFYSHSSSDRNIILGYRSLYLSDITETPSNIDDCIIIGNSLFVDESPESYTLAIGTSDSPFVTGLMKGAQRNFTILSSDGEDTRFKLKKGNLDYNLGLSFENSRHVVTFGSDDSLSEAQSRAMMSMRFKNKNNVNQTLMDFDPSGTISITPTFAQPTFKRPTVSVSGDLRMLGAIRFFDGSSLDSVSDLQINRALAASGLKRLLIDGEYYWGLDFDGMPLAINLGDLDISQSYLPLDVNASDGMGKISISDLSAYVTSGAASYGVNCNGVFTNLDNFDNVSQTLNSHSVFIGCDVAANATGWKHGVFIGTEAGKEATTPNSSLSSDTAPVFIGYQAGHTSINTNDSIFIGNGAGKNADSSNKSIFIGPGAGANATNSNSIGIGQHALEGEISDSEGGQRNIEIVAGLDDNQRLLYTRGELSDRLNIQNSIFAYTKTPSVSIGKARAFPSGAPLEVVRDTTDAGYSLGHTDPNVQYWINNDRPAARVSESGHLITQTSGVDYGSQPSQTVDSWFGTHEGFMEDYIYAPSSFNSPTSGWMVTRSYENGFGADRRILVINRDTKQNIHGQGAVGGAAYVITMVVNGEHRPVYISCSGSS